MKGEKIGHRYTVAFRLEPYPFNPCRLEAPTFGDLWLNLSLHAHRLNYSWIDESDLRKTLPKNKLS